LRTLLLPPIEKVGRWGRWQQPQIIKVPGSFQA
jgi:hypothetical protein